jgi:DSF synthase
VRWVRSVHFVGQYLEFVMTATAEIRALPQSNLSQVQTRFDREYGVYWAHMNARPRPCFSLELLSELRMYLDAIIDSHSQAQATGHKHAVKYGVLASKTPGIFNLGGDLSLFRRLIEQRDREGLMRYGEACINNLYPWHVNCDLPMTSISLVQGDALGGGFEAALSATVLIAEESARMGFPEILFNLFPGMGAYSFLSRKVGRRTAEEMITSGMIYSARQLYDLGVVDVITPEGTGEQAVYSYIRRHSKNANGRHGFERARNEVVPVTRDELMRVVRVWADTALNLSERDLRMMERLIRAQLRSPEPTVDETMGKVVSIHASADRT